MLDLDQLITHLEAEHQLIGERLRLARELRATFNTGADPVPAPVSPPTPDLIEARRAADRDRKARTRERAGKPARGQQIACPDCGEMMGSPAGLGIHRKHKHPGAAAKPIAPVPAPKVAPEPPTDETPTVLFECSDCEARTPNKQALARHTTERHHRGLHAEEHLAIDPAKAAA